MWYILIIVIAILIINWVIKNTFLWETIIKSLWKRIYIKADRMSSFLNDGTADEIFKEDIEIEGKLINSILDYVNKKKKENDEDSEEETFGYGRYNPERILNAAKNNPEFFKKLAKK